MDSNHSRLQIDTIAVRLIHGRKKKPRRFSSNMTWQDVEAAVCQTFPDLKNGQEKSEKNSCNWHLEFDNGTWIEDNEDWQTAILFYQSLLTKKQKQLATKDKSQNKNKIENKNSNNTESPTNANTTNENIVTALDLNAALPRFELFVVKGVCVLY